MGFGDRLRCRRREMQLSQRALATRAGVDDTYISRMERREATPSAGVLARLARALALSMDALWHGDPSAPPAEFSEALRVFVATGGVALEDISMLAGITYQGKRPATPEDYGAVYWAIKRAVYPPDGRAA